jgi:geranylgeranyl diphosphate synthase, type I
MTTLRPSVLTRGRELVEPALRAAIDRFEDPVVRTVAGYHFGWLDAEGNPVPSASSGKAIRPTLAVLSAEAVGAEARVGVPGAVAVELVHNFSLLHDDIMDHDVERRHRPTAWVVFGSGAAILAGNAMLTAAVQELTAAGPGGQRALTHLLTAVQELIKGQSEDLALEGAAEVALDQVLHMEAGKTAALLACAASIGAVIAGADDGAVDHLAGYGHELGMAFQLVDDILGIVGDAAVTGKSASSDIRAGKRSAPIVAALRSGTPAGTELSAVFAGAAPETDAEVARARELVTEAGGLDWAGREADHRLAAALAHLDALGRLQGSGSGAAPIDELTELARYVVERDV